MRLLATLIGSVWVGGLLVLPASSQQPPAGPTCEQQVQAQYAKLVTDKVLTDTAMSSWSQQLMALAAKVRTQKTELDVRQSQETQAVQNVAQLLEQLRQAQEYMADMNKQNAELRTELERLKGEKPAP